MKSEGSLKTTGSRHKKEGDANVRLSTNTRISAAQEEIAWGSGDSELVKEGRCKLCARKGQKARKVQKEKRVETRTTMEDTAQAGFRPQQHKTQK